MNNEGERRGGRKTLEDGEKLVMAVKNGRGEWRSEERRGKER